MRPDTGLTGRRLVVAAAGLGLAVTCTDERVGVPVGPHLLAVTFDEQFWIGDDPSERPFARITSLAFAPNGHLVVVDRDAFAVLVLDPDGREVLEWGGEGEGPGEFENEPTRVAVSVDGNVAVSSYRRVDVFTPEGVLIGSHLLDDLSVDEIAFDGDGYVLAEVNTGREALNEREAQEQLMRLRDREVLWSFPTIPPQPNLAFFFPSSLTAGLDDARIATAVDDHYDIDIRNTLTGRVAGRITRNIVPRETPEELKTGIRESLIELAGGDPAMAEMYESMEFAETLPVLAAVFLGPPGRTLWVRRGIGVDDELAPPVGDDIDAWELRLYDLFDGDTYEYIGTVESPDLANFSIMAGDSERIAGLHRDELGVHSVRVLRVEIEKWP